ncbi:MAG: hypothetical protein ACJAZ9_001119 [Neolewinella sp.]
MVLSYGGCQGPCGDGFYGEVQDYAVRLTSFWNSGFQEEAEVIAFNPEGLQTINLPATKLQQGVELAPLVSPALPSRNMELVEEVKVFPSPTVAGGELTILTDKGARTQVQEIVLKSMVGQTLATYSTQEANRIQLPANLTPGLYLLSGNDAEGNQAFSQGIKFWAIKLTGWLTSVVTYL